MTCLRENWPPLAAVVLVTAVSAFLLALGGCSEGTAGEVCHEPGFADCDSHEGGEAGE